MERLYTPTALKTELTVDRLVSLHYFAYGKSFCFEGESHDFWELVYTDSGEAKIKDGETEFTLPQGYAFLHAPNHYHTVRPNDKYTNVTVISFFGLLGVCEKAATRPIPLSPSDKSLIKTILSEGRQAFSEPLNIVEQYALNVKDDADVGCLQLIKNSLECLLISLYRHVALDTHIPIVSKSQNYFEFISAQIIRLLETHLDGNLTLTYIADKLGYSLTYIKKIFKSVTGTSIIKYYIKLKIDKAKQLISESTYTVSQISEMLGFDSVQYFCRQFRIVTNMTPTAYQKSVKLAGVL